MGFVLAFHILSSSPLGAQQIEPLAGTWKTWVLASGSQLRLPPPPLSEFGTEVSELRTLETQLTAAAIDTVKFWDTGSPEFRWIEMLYSLGSGASNARAYTLLSVAMYDATIAAWDSKYTYNRPRPSDLEPALTPAMPNPGSPSYPSEHAVVAGAASAVLSYLFPDKADTYAVSKRIQGVKPQADETVLLHKASLSG